MKTFTPKPADLTHDWYIIDAADVVLGRLSVAAANLLRGKNKPTFAPHADSGNYVIIINADKIALTGDKMAVVKPADILVDCCVSLRGPSKRFPTRHKDFQGAHGNEIGTRMCADHAIWVKIRNTIVEKVYRENFHTETS